MSPNEVELFRLGRVGRRMRIGMTVAILLVLVAVAKPWLELGATPHGPSSPPGASLTGLSTGPAIASGGVGKSASALCESPDGWRIVADDVEFGRPIRSWLVATVEYSTGRPVRSTIPETVVISKAVDRLGFCLPASMARPAVGWSATLWQVEAGSADPALWRLAARLMPPPGALGAIAKPLNSSTAGWSPGRYVLETRFAGTADEAWLGLAIQPAP